jgi:hypothetical protein
VHDRRTAQPLAAPLQAYMIGINASCVCARARATVHALLFPLLSSIRACTTVWFVANCATFCLRLVVRIQELTLVRKVRQSVASYGCMVFPPLPTPQLKLYACMDRMSVSSMISLRIEHAYAWTVVNCDSSLYQCTRVLYYRCMHARTSQEYVRACLDMHAYAC